MPRKKEVVGGTFVKYDAVVLGSGPAGEGAAMKLAKSGKRVAIVDVREQLGGNCTHVGTIPSKALRQTVSSIIRYRRDPMFKKMGDWRLEDCDMYVTLEPCQMCAGAIVQARMKRVVIGCMNPKAGCAGSVLNILQVDAFNHQVEIEQGVLEEECSQMLTNFFKALRKRVKLQKQ